MVNKIWEQRKRKKRERKERNDERRIRGSSSKCVKDIGGVSYLYYMLVKRIRKNIREEVNKMGKCELCSKEGSRMEANHKELGRIMVCQDCWVNLYDKNRMTCSVDASGGSCSCCSCR